LRTSLSYYFPEELTARVWVDYFGYFGPIVTYNLTQLPVTYNQQGPFRVTCSFSGPNEITEEDTLLLYSSVNYADTVSVSLQEMVAGSSQYYADITGPFSLGDEIRYWVHTINEMGQEFTSPAYQFAIIVPADPGADLLIVTQGSYNHAMYTVMDCLDVRYESFNGSSGIDESVVYWGWDNIIVTGWGIDVLGPEDETDLFNDFLDNGGNLCLLDQDWFYANGCPAEGTLEPGDFGYDYFGIESYYNDTEDPEAVYNGVSGDPITGSFSDNPYETWWDGGIHLEPESFWADYIIPGNGEGIFFGVVDNDCYGVRNTIGDAKTVYLSFMAEASCEFYEDSVAVSADFQSLMTNICEWFEIPIVSVETHSAANPKQFELCANYPNPFNAETVFSVILPGDTRIEISVYNISGQLVECIFDGSKKAGIHQLQFNGENLPSGIYLCNVTTDYGSKARRMVLMK